MSLAPFLRVPSLSEGLLLGEGEGKSTQINYESIIRFCNSKVVSEHRPESKPPAASIVWWSWKRGNISHKGAWMENVFFYLLRSATEGQENAINLHIIIHDV